MQFICAQNCPACGLLIDLAETKGALEYAVKHTRQRLADGLRA
jgi:hypothetical protein